MKVIFVFVAVCVAVSMAEMCRNDGDCNHETCVGDGWSINCHFGTCTCDHSEHTGGDCTSADQCGGRCLNGRPQHCVDGRCRCLF